MNQPIKLTDLEIDALRKAFEFCYKNGHYNPALQRAMDKVFRSQNYNAQQSVQRIYARRQS